MRIANLTPRSCCHRRSAKAGNSATTDSERTPIWNCLMSKNKQEYAAFDKGAESPAADAIDTIFRTCHGLDEDLKSRRATGPEVCLMECRARLVAAGVCWDADA